MSITKQYEKRSFVRACELSPESDSNELKLITKERNYVCKQCGRSASHQENLCQPEKLHSTW
jgi:hypothetical protein